jgi:hypothetical protein
LEAFLFLPPRLAGYVLIQQGLLKNVAGRIENKVAQLSEEVGVEGATFEQLLYRAAGSYDTD